MPTLTVRLFEYDVLKAKLKPDDRILILSCDSCAKKSDGLGGQQALIDYRLSKGPGDLLVAVQVGMQVLQHKFFTDGLKFTAGNQGRVEANNNVLGAVASISNRADKITACPESEAIQVLLQHGSFPGAATTVKCH